jgi:hypothetical protein
MNADSIVLMKYFIAAYCKGGDVLDVGSCCMHGQPTYRELFDPSRYNYMGMDVCEGPNVDIVGYESISKKYDIVISGQVMEHVKRPWDWLKNLVQYTRTYICIIAPHTHREHRYPIDTYRYFPDGMADLFDYAGIHAIEIFKSNESTIGIGNPQNLALDY